MAGTFFGINIASSGLAAQRQAMDVLSQNIAHANDPSYKRQRLVMTEGLPLAQSQEGSSVGISAMGSGVQTGAVQRVRDSLIENRLRQAGESSAQYDFMTKTLSQLEAAIGEPSDTGLQTDLDAFWASWNKVATSPDSVSIRSSLLDDTQSLCARIQYVYNQIRSSQTDLNLSAVSDVNTVNAITDEIARINNEVAAMSNGSAEANDLLNRRDALVQDLSKLASISQYGEGGGDFVVTLGGKVLVQGTRANHLATEVRADGNQAIRWAEDGADAIIQGGELRALQDLRDTMIPSYLAQLNDFTTALVTQVNTLHHTGKTMAGGDGGDFFLAGSTAGTIALDPSMIDQPRLIAVSSTGAVGNSQVALAIAGLKDTADAATGLTINARYRALVGDVGSAMSMADKQSQAHNLSFQQFQTQQQSISGVSLDEEMTNMIKFQQAYNASARLITVMDEMLGVLVERTGSVGR